MTDEIRPWLFAHVSASPVSMTTVKSWMHDENAQLKVLVGDAEEAKQFATVAYGLQSMPPQEWILEEGEWRNHYRLGRSNVVVAPAFNPLPPRYIPHAFSWAYLEGQLWNLAKRYSAKLHHHNSALASDHDIAVHVAASLINAICQEATSENHQQVSDSPLKGNDSFHTHMQAWAGGFDLTQRSLALVLYPDLLWETIMRQ